MHEADPDLLAPAESQGALRWPGRVSVRCALHFVDISYFVSISLGFFLHCYLMTKSNCCSKSWTQRTENRPTGCSLSLS